MRRSLQQPTSTTDNIVRIEQVSPLPSTLPKFPAQTSNIPALKQASSNQSEMPPKSPTEQSSVATPKSPEQVTITTTPKEPPKSPYELTTPPPLDSSGHSANASLKLPFVIGVSGGTASGKTEVCNMISERLRNSEQFYESCRVVRISQDSFYRGPEFNFDDPDAFDKEKLLDCIQKLKSGQSVQVPQYNFKKQSFDSNLQVDPCDVLILEGLFLLQCPRVRGSLDMKIFIDTDADVRLARRIKRDTYELDRNVTSVLEQYMKLVKPAFDTHIFPSRMHADFIIPNGVENHVAMDTILEQVHKKIGSHKLSYKFPNVIVIDPTFQIRCIHAIIRDKEIAKHEFIFYSDRLVRLVVEQGLAACFPHTLFTEKQVTTPQGKPFKGLTFSKKICGISIDRSGVGMENALRACCAEIVIGNIRIPYDQVHDTLPKDISGWHILLLDPLLTSGESTIQAIKFLKDKRRVPEYQIILLNIISAQQGIERVCKQFPDLKVVTSWIDDGPNEQGNVIPGMGDFGGRYYGTND